MKKRISLKRIEDKELIKAFSEVDKAYKKIRRGRPRKYNESLIYFALAYKILKKLSFRDLVFEFKSRFKEFPTLSTLHYRISRVNINLLRYFIKKLANKIKNIYKNFKYLIADGTGFGYSDTFYMKLLRGEKLRKAKYHTKAEVLIYANDDNITFIEDINLDKAYSDERKLVFDIIKYKKFNNKIYFLADKLYSQSNKLAKFLILKTNLIPVVSISDALRNKVRNPDRLKLKQFFDENKSIYKKRYLIEQTFGKIKNSYDDKDFTFSLNLSKIYTAMRFLLYNLAVFISFHFLFFERTKFIPK